MSSPHDLVEVESLWPGDVINIEGEWRRLNSVEVADSGDAILVLEGKRFVADWKTTFPIQNSRV